jgi:uncharacterized protein YqgC (DUF456 family)
MKECMLALFIASFLIAVGLLGTLLPILPGTVIAFAGIVIHKLMLGEASVSWSIVLMASLITVLTLLIDVWCTWWGARRFGATVMGAVGAVLGAIFGLLFFSLPGLVIGPVVGAVLFELLNDRSGQEATRAGFGTVIGAVVGFFLKLGLTTGMVAAFYLALI